LPNAILVVYIHVHYSIYVIISLYLKAISCTPKRTCASMHAFPYNNWGIGLEAAKMTRLVTTKRGIRRMIHPSLTKRYKTNDRQLRYHRLPIIMYTDTMFSTILSRQKNKAAQIFCTDFGFVRAFPLKKEKEAHDALSLLFHRDGVHNVMVMDGVNAQVEG
jgi:hypothetical protein